MLKPAESQVHFLKLNYYLLGAYQVLSTSYLTSLPRVALAFFLAARASHRLSHALHHSRKMSHTDSEGNGISWALCITAALLAALTIQFLVNKR